MFRKICLLLAVLAMLGTAFTGSQVMARTFYSSQQIGDMYVTYDLPPGVTARDEYSGGIPYVSLMDSYNGSSCVHYLFATASMGRIVDYIRAFASEVRVQTVNEVRQGNMFILEGYNRQRGEFVQFDGRVYPDANFSEVAVYAMPMNNKTAHRRLMNVVKSMDFRRR